MASREHHAEHTRVIDAPADVVYAVVSDATLWPAVFEPSVHVRHLERSEREERFELWASVNGEVVSWISRRTLDPTARSVAFAQEVSHPPVASMAGRWTARERADGRTEVVLVHDFTLVDDSPATLKRITSALDHNSTRELAALAEVAELGERLEDIAFSFTDSVEFHGPSADAYEFVARADLWPERLPHVSGVRIGEPEPGVQEMEMDTVTPDGSTHTTQSVRVCRGPEWIAYKQIRTPRLLLGHSGLWTFTDGHGPGGAVAHSTHTVVIDPGAVEAALGAGRTLADARAYVREALGRNSWATMSHAAAYAERPAVGG